MSEATPIEKLHSMIWNFNKGKTVHNYSEQSVSDIKTEVKNQLEAISDYLSGSLWSAKTTMTIYTALVKNPQFLSFIKLWIVCMLMN